MRGFDGVLPAGTYDVETDEERLESISFPAYRRILTLIHLHPKLGLTQSLEIDPNELDAALMRDQAAEEITVCRDAGQKTLNGTAEPHGDGADRQAIERGEDEGMAIHPC